jgi:hypothetical protein
LINWNGSERKLSRCIQAISMYLQGQSEENTEIFTAHDVPLQNRTEAFRKLASDVIFKPMTSCSLRSAADRVRCQISSCERTNLQETSILCQQGLVQWTSSWPKCQSTESHLTPQKHNNVRTSQETHCVSTTEPKCSGQTHGDTRARMSSC